MGKGQKKGGSTSGGHHHSRKSPSYLHKSNASPLSLNDNNNQLKNDLETILDEDQSLDFTWKEIGQGLSSIILCALVSVVVGVAVGITVSIQYLDVNDALMVGTRGGGSDEESKYRHAAAPQVLFHHSRITIFDPAIASCTPLSSGSDPVIIDGSRVSNPDRVLSLVEESPPLGQALNQSSAVHSKTKQQNMPLIDPPVSSFEQFSQVQPVLCKSDGISYGYETWETLRKAFQEADSYSADRFMRWNKYFATTKGTFQGTFDNPKHYYEEAIHIRICPDTVIRGKRGPLAFVNSENIVLECQGCTIQIRHGSHLTFGPHAKNIMIRGVSFKGATSTSLQFHYDGAEVSLQDCFFLDNTGTAKQLGSVADVNSTSIINFYRCLMKHGPNERASGLTSLSIRSKDAEL